LPAQCDPGDRGREGLDEHRVHQLPVDQLLGGQQPQASPACVGVQWRPRTPRRGRPPILPRPDRRFPRQPTPPAARSFLPVSWHRPGRPPVLLGTAQVVDRPAGPCLMAHTGAPFPREFGVRRPPTTPGSATARPDPTGRVGPCAGRRRSHQGSATNPSLLPSQRRVRRSSRRPRSGIAATGKSGARLAARPDTCCLHPAEGFRDRGPRRPAMPATSSCSPVMRSGAGRDDFARTSRDRDGVLQSTGEARRSAGNARSS
jgi:hypothetical protein